MEATRICNIIMSITFSTFSLYSWGFVVVVVLSFLFLHYYTLLTLRLVEHLRKTSCTTKYFPRSIFVI